MILNILLILLGVSLLVYSLCELRVWGGLFFDRDIYCIEKFRATEKAADLVSCWHNVAKGVFGFLVILAGLRPWLPDAGRLTQSYPRHIVAMGLGMILIMAVGL